MTPAAEEAPEYLIARIQEALATDPRTGELELDVRIAGGRIFLTGTVSTLDRCAAVEEVVRELAPDYRVSNELSCVEVPDPGPEENLP